MQLVIRTLDVLRHLAANNEGQTLLEMAVALKIPSPTLHRLLGVLVEQEFVVRSGDKRYAIGAAALSLARGARSLNEVAQVHMRQLAAATQETVFLTELVGRRTICVALVDGTRPLRLSVRVGQELPMHAAASARAILSQLPDSEVESLLRERTLTAYTPSTPASVDDVRRHLVEVRLRGYDVCDEELDLNVIAVSAPVPTHGLAGPASLTIAAPRERMSKTIQRRWSTDLLSAADTIVTELGVGPTGLRSVAGSRGSM